MSRMLGATLAALIALAPLGVRAADAPLVMKLGTAAQHDHQTEYLQRYADAVQKDSKGRIDPQVFAAGVLGSIPRMIEDVQFGSIQGWMGTPSFLSGIDRSFEITEFPLFGDRAPYLATIHDPSFQTPFLAMGADKGLHPVADVYSGEAGLVLRRPVRTLADLKGLKIRCTPNAIEESELRLLGVTPVPMPLDQVLPALQQGAIDGVVITIGVASPLKFYAVAKYFYDMAMIHTLNIVTVSATWYASLPPDLRAIVDADAPKVGREMLNWTIAFNERQKQEWVAGGGVWIPITPQDRARFLSIVRPVGEDVTKGDPAEHALFEKLIASARKRGFH